MNDSSHVPSYAPDTGALTDREVRQWTMFLHLSQLAGYVVPLAGIVVPIVMWRTKRDQSPVIDEHGRMVVNVMLSYFCYWISAILLSIVLIGIPLLIVLGIASVAFPIIGAIRADEGKLWRYPLVIPFV